MLGSLLFSIRIFTMILFALLWQIVTTTLYDPNQYSLGENLITNPLFDTPTLSSNRQFRLYPSGIPGWTCSTTCQLVHFKRRCTGYGTSCNTISFVQGLDLDSSDFEDHVYQTLSVGIQGQYYLKIGWMPPLDTPIGKVFRIKLNSVILATITISDSRYIDHYSQFVVDLTVGASVLELIMYGNNPDTYGVYMGSASLQRLIPTYTSTSLSEVLGPIEPLNSALFDNVAKPLNKMPGNRIFTSTLTNFLSTFDRMQFYYYHKHKLTHYSYVLLSNANTIVLERGSLPQTLLESCDADICKSVTETYSSLLNTLDFKKNYTDSDFLSKNQNGIGFFANNLQFFYYELPFLTCTYLVLSVLFRMLFNYRVSKMIRKYAFYGMLLYVMYEGNVEIFAFYFFAECKNLFSFNFTHKLANVFMIYFFFLVIFISVGGLVWFYYHYKKLVKYFMEDSQKVSFEAMVLQSLERAVFPLLFGCFHALLIDNLWIQTVVLFGVELCYFAARMFTLHSSTPLYKFKVAIYGVTSLIRLAFIVTLYLYEEQGHPTIINLIHHDLVWLYLICWLVQFMHDIIVFFVDIFEVFKVGRKKSRPSKGGQKRSTLQTNSRKEEKMKVKSEKCQVKQLSFQEINLLQKNLLPNRFSLLVQKLSNLRQFQIKNRLTLQLKKKLKTQSKSQKQKKRQIFVGHMISTFRD